MERKQMIDQNVRALEALGLGRALVRVLLVVPNPEPSGRERLAHDEKVAK